MNTDPSATFEPHRRRLLGLAYRMLGSVAEAEDAVQEAYLRWHDTDRNRVEDPRAFLMTTTTRIGPRSTPRRTARARCCARSLTTSQRSTEESPGRGALIGRRSR